MHGCSLEADLLLAYKQRLEKQALAKFSGVVITDSENFLPQKMKCDPGAHPGFQVTNADNALMF